MSVELTEDAQEDLFTIYLFGLRTWNSGQAEAYSARIHSVFQVIGANPFIGVHRDSYGEQTRMFPVENHIIYYELRPTGILILRILHSSADAWPDRLQMDDE